LRHHAQPLGRCEVLLRGVDQTRFFPPAERTTHQRALFVGHVQKAKGVFDLLSAWVRVRRACPNALLSVVGPDRTDGRLPRKVHALGVGNSVTLTGPLPPAMVADLDAPVPASLLAQPWRGHTELRNGSVVLWPAGRGDACGWDP